MENVWLMAGPPGAYLINYKIRRFFCTGRGAAGEHKSCRLVIVDEAEPER